MPIRQHPLVRYYARATQLISLASLAGNDFPSTEDVIEYFGMAVAALPPLEPGADRRHDEIRDALESVARGGKPEYVPFEVQARWAAGRLADHTAQLATRGREIPAQVVPGSLLHCFSDGLSDQERHGLGHRRILEVTDFGVTFVVTDGDKAGTVGHFEGWGDPEDLAEFLLPTERCGSDCLRGQ